MSTLISLNVISQNEESRRDKDQITTILRFTKKSTTPRR